MREFKGRVVTPGTVTAEAVVSREGFNTLASLQSALQFGDKTAKCGPEQCRFVWQTNGWKSTLLTTDNWFYNGWFGSILCMRNGTSAGLYVIC